MSARDDYPYWPAPNDRRFSAEGAWHWSVAMDEIDRQRRWAAEAKASLDDWHSTLEPMIPEAFKDGRLGDRWPQVVADYIAELQADLQAERDRQYRIVRRLNGISDWITLWVKLS